MDQTIARECDIDMPLPLVIFGKTLLEYDGNLHKLEPTLDVVDTFRPYLEEMYKNGQLPEEIGPSIPAIPTTVNELLENIDELPTELRKIVKHLSDDGVEFTVRLGKPASPDSEIKSSTPQLDNK